MTEMTACPRCGAALTAGSPGDRTPGRPADVGPPEFPEEATAAVPLLASGSNDDQFFGPIAADPGSTAMPDSNLGTFVEVAPPPLPPAPVAAPRPTLPGSADLFLGLDLSSAASGRAKPRHEPIEGEFDDEPPARTPWSTVLLASYASASTLALAWLLLHQKPRAEARAAVEPPAAAVDTRADPGHQARLSRRVEPPRPIPSDRIAALGQPLKVGSLEVKPIEVRRQEVMLFRPGLAGRPELRAGGKGAFVLRLGLRNLSTDLVFAPIDSGFVREDGPGVIDSFVETAGGTVVYPYPLAIESELSIVDQDFGPLRPGESRVVAVATSPDAPGDDQGPFLWRIRVRTGIDRTDTIGVRWSGPTPGPPAGPQPSPSPSKK